MTSASAACFVCGCPESTEVYETYRRCADCGHEILASTQAQGFIVNEPLVERDVRRTNGLDRFKRRVLLRFSAAQHRGLLLDIGSASGRFLLQNGRRYARAIGIEVTPEAVKFSREALALDVVEGIADVPQGVEIATAWHSLEHIPQTQLLALLGGLAERLVDGGRIIVSVPNAASRQYRWFGRRYAYFDVPNHLHQFTSQSLERLLRRFGLHRIAAVDSTPYNSFGYAQGLLNVITGTHNYLYYRLKRRTRAPSLLLDLAHLFLLPLVVPLGWVLGLLDARNHETQGVITACFEKKTC